MHVIASIGDEVATESRQSNSAALNSILGVGNLVSHVGEFVFLFQHKT